MYKRQEGHGAEHALGIIADHGLENDVMAEAGVMLHFSEMLVAVSYTHLTLPTSDLV